MQQKVIVDTNVFVSALIQKGYPFLILNEVFRNKKILLCISKELFKEYANVLSREKFKKFPDFETNANALPTDVINYSRMYLPSKKLNVIPDESDNRLLELAEVAKAHFLITGNHNDFTMQRYKITRIITPKEFWEEVIMK